MTTRDPEDTPELLQRLEENARMLPFLWKAHWDAQFDALPQKEKQEILDNRAALRKEIDEEKKREQEAIDRFFSRPPPGGIPEGLFAIPKNKQKPAGSVPPNLNLDNPTSTEARKREHEEIGSNTDPLAPSDSQEPGSRASKRARTNGADIQLGPAQHTDSQDESIKDSVRPDERVPSANDVTKPPSSNAVADPPSANDAAEPSSANDNAEVPSANAVVESPSAPSNSSPQRVRKSRTTRRATKAKPLVKIPIRRSARITALRSKKPKLSKLIRSSKKSKNRQIK